MPPIFDEYKGLRFYATSHNTGEPIHVHVGHSEKNSGNMKVWITDTGISVANYGTALSRSEKKEALEYILDNRDRMIAAWMSYFKHGNVKHDSSLSQLKL